MKKHCKVYSEAFFLAPGEAQLCERCLNAAAVDIHHIKAKGMGGSRLLDFIDNLIGLCRRCHTKAHNHPEVNENLNDITCLGVDERILRLRKAMHG